MPNRGGKVLGLMLLAALAFAPGVGAPAVADVKPPQRIARVPFELNGSMIFVPVRVNGSRPMSFALDTGAFLSVINTTTVGALGLKTSAHGGLAGAGGRVASVGVPGLTLDIGGAQLAGVNAAATPLVSLENTVGRAMDGILGAEFFRRFVVEIDYERGHIDLYEPKSFEYRGRGESFPLSFYDNHPYVRAKVELPGRPPIEGEFVLDAGSNFPVILLPSFVEEHNLRDALPPTWQTFGRGVGGEIALPLGRASRLLLGGFAFERPVTAFPKSGTFGRSGKAGNIGSAVLRRFTVTFDYSRRRMILEPNARFGEPFEHDMTGLGLVAESPHFKVLKVNRVLPGSPAEAAGIRQGDELVSVNGRPAAEYKLAELREMFRRADRQYRFQLRRGAELLKVELKTRRLV